MLRTDFQEVPTDGAQPAQISRDCAGASAARRLHHAHPVEDSADHFVWQVVPPSERQRDRHRVRERQRQRQRQRQRDRETESERVEVVPPVRTAALLRSLPLPLGKKPVDNRRQRSILDKHARVKPAARGRRAQAMRTPVRSDGGSLVGPAVSGNDWVVEHAAGQRADHPGDCQAIR